ncbi:MAG: response regulator [Christensenellaceae bacterium]|nr:response regulator [Christensenellaceae bacterium]
MDTKKKSISLRQLFIAAVVIILAAFLLINVSLMHAIAVKQTEDIGRMRIRNISAGFQQTLLRAQNTLERVCDDLEETLAADPTEDDVRRFLSQQKAREHTLSDGACLNIFCTFNDVILISDEETPDDYIIQDRPWYRGLLANRDQNYYISRIYENELAANNLCFTIVRILSDGQTVAGVHYSIEEIQAHVKEISRDGYGDVLIVDDGETIAGCSNPSALGQSLSAVYPQYQSVYLKAAATDTASQTLQSVTDSANGSLFCVRLDEGWYMLCSVNDQSYQSSYKRLLRNFVLLLVILAAAACVYAYLRRGRGENGDGKEQRPSIFGLLAIVVTPLRWLLRLFGFGRKKKVDEPQEDESEKVDHEVLSSKAKEDRKSSRRKTRNHITAEEQAELTATKQRQYRIGITVIFIVTMLIAIVVSAMMTVRESHVRMQVDLQNYKNDVTNWVQEQRNILEMFSNVIMAQPEMLDDYDGMVKFLDDVTRNYPRISATYIANPDFSHGHAIVMNNGWVPDPDYHVEERSWYTGALSAVQQSGFFTSATKNGYAVSEPYYDVRTGEYCLTFSKALTSPNGDLYGVFAIDYYVDALSDILNDNLSSTGYAFLVDKNGKLFDHPNSEYNFSVSVHSLVYYKLYRKTGMVTIKDYDGVRRVCASIGEPTAGFRLFVVKDWMSIYGNIFVYSFLYVILFGVCITAIHLIIYRLLQWQRQTNNSFKEAAESAIRAEKAKMQFLSNISHELRTPINAVLGMNEMILREARDEKLRSYAMNIQSSGKTLLFLINDILDMSKIESGKMKIVPVQYEPGELVVDLWNVIYLRAQEKGLTISFSMDENVPRILFGDDVRIKQIVTNLLTNAVKYTHKGGVEMRVSYANTGFKMIALVISVKDSGIGIKKEDMGRLFESFQRLEEERNRNIEGAGLGMSITMSLLKQMGGDMRVESEYQKGSTFTVTIPQRVIDGEPTGDFETVKNRQHQAMQNSGGHKNFEAPKARVLVVDDNDMNRAVFKALLSRTKIQVSAAESGMKCLEMIQKEPYHIIFMDHMMPEMDGIETLAEIQKLPADSLNAQTPVIALTANALAGARDDYLKKGFSDFLTKPIDSEMLENMILCHLPADLVTMIEEQVQEAPEEASDNGEYMKYGISVEQGLHYSTGNMDVYLDLISMFLKDTERLQKLTQYLAEQNMKDYSILVHALKGNARTLGAQKLADIAFEHEQSSKADHIEAVQSGWDALIAAWKEAKEGLSVLYRDHRGEDILPEAADSEAQENEVAGEAIAVTPEELASVAEMIDNFESEKAVEQLKTWLKSPLEKDTRDLIKKALVALEDEFDEGRAMKLLKGEH